MATVLRLPNGWYAPLYRYDSGPEVLPPEWEWLLETTHFGPRQRRRRRITGNVCKPKRNGTRRPKRKRRSA